MVMQAGKRGEVTAWKKMKVRSSAQREIITAAAAFLSPSRALLLAAQMSNFTGFLSARQPARPEAHRDGSESSCPQGTHSLVGVTDLHTSHCSSVTRSPRSPGRRFRISRALVAA